MVEIVENRESDSAFAFFFCMASSLDMRRRWMGTLLTEEATERLRQKEGSGLSGPTTPSTSSMTFSRWETAGLEPSDSGKPRTRF